VNIIPHTAQITTMQRKVGDEVNIETDLIGKIRGKVSERVRVNLQGKRRILIN